MSPSTQQARRGRRSRSGPSPRLLLSLALVVGAAVLASAGCRATEPVTPPAAQRAARCEPLAPIEPPEIVGQRMPETLGEPLARIEGGGLEAPLEVPLWLDFSGEADRDHCAKGVDVVAVALDGHRLLVQQHGLTCGGQRCRIYDTAGRVLADQAPCLHAALGRIASVQPLGGEHFLVRGSAEGVPTQLFVRYTASAGPQELLRTEVGFRGHALSATPCLDGSIQLETTCPLPAGCSTQTPQDAPLQRYRLRLTEAGAELTPLE